MGTTLIAYYPFDNSGQDTSGNPYYLNLYGGVGFASGRFCQALDLHHNGTQNAARPSSDPVFDFGSNDFTVSLWLYFYDTNGEQTLIEKWSGQAGPGWTLTKLNGNGLRFATSFASGGILNSTALNIETAVWHNIVVRRAGANWTLSYDGQAVDQVAKNQQIDPSPYPLLVGRRDPQDGRDFSVNGRIDDAAIWNGSLSDDQVTRLWNGGTGTPANALG